MTTHTLPSGRAKSKASHEHPCVAAWRARLTPVTVVGLRTFVLDEGLGDPVVMLHGIPTQAFMWRDVAEIVRRQRRVIAPDLLGFGLADKPRRADLSPAGQASFMQGVLRQLGVERYALVAHDYGALVAAELLEREPERVTHLVLTNTSVWEEDWRGAGRSPFALLRAPLLGEAAFALARPFMLKRAFMLYSANRARWTRAVMAVYWQPFREGFSDILLALARRNRPTPDDFCRYRDAVHAYPGPALVVWGGLDPTFRTDRGLALANILRDGHFELFEHSNHYVAEDRPEALGRLIEVFLDGRFER
jgi:haloalkane dehalogenase